LWTIVGLVLLASHFFFQAEDGIRDRNVTGVQTCALPILEVSLVFPFVPVTAILTISSVGFPKKFEAIGPMISLASSTTKYGTEVSISFSLINADTLSSNC